jgi:hypothetical protein
MELKSGRDVILDDGTLVKVSDVLEDPEEGEQVLKNLL